MKQIHVASVLIAGLGFACVQVQPATDTGGITSGVSASTSTGPSAAATPTPGTGAASPTPTPLPGATPTGTSLAYTQDLQPVFASDCVVCHSDRNPLGHYSMTTYAGVMKDVTPGSASSTLVRLSQSNGSMYRYWSGDRAAKAKLTSDWVVANKAAQNR